MLFNTQAFILTFLPLTLAVYYLSARSMIVREWTLVAASMVFYAYWDVRFLPLLLGSIVVNWGLAQMHAGKSRIPIVAFGTLLNVALLAYFKYWDFFGGSVAELLHVAYEPSDIILPIGISFFTFQQLSYLIDLKRGQAPIYNLRHYALYISFFPQLIAGPVVRHNELIPQLDTSPYRPEIWRLLASGAVLFVIGLVKKFAIADKMAPHVEAVFKSAATGAIATQDAWTGSTSFALQIYFDFSAYSDMAIGLALLFGFKLPQNFNAPYRAVSLRDFWRRWHMTLSRFFRDYLYIPLGGNRHGFAIQAGALMLTMSLCGLWHGAGWTFVLWGAMHGIGLVANNAWRKAGLPMPPLIGFVITSAFVLFAWVLFRADTMAAVQAIWRAMVGIGPEAAVKAQGFNAKLFIAGWAVILLLPTSQTVIGRLLQPWRALGLILGIGLAALLLELGKGRPVEFIYFAF